VGTGVAVGVAVGVSVAVGVGVGVGEPDCAQYLPPAFILFVPSSPPQTIISLSVQTAVCSYRPVGALTVLVAVQLSVPGSYCPPVLKKFRKSYPPQTIISVSVRTAV
jgi:hypothetical protein